jgi:type II secretory pathway pseudopilin PulG
MKNTVKHAKTGTVWVSTVLYVLISLVILSIVFISVQPVIERSKDKVASTESLNMLKDIDSMISEVSANPGNVRILDLKISRGTLIISSSADYILWELPDSYYQYGQENKIINLTEDGVISTISQKSGNRWDVKIKLDYTISGRYNLTYNGLEETKSITPAEYQLSITNVNASAGAPVQIDLSVD